MLRKKIFPALFFVAFFLSCNITQAQDRAYAKQVIDTLASPSMHGRGYVNNGDGIAAKYIAAQFRNLHLVAFNIAGLYTQSFSFPVNTFPGKMEVTLEWSNGKKINCTPDVQFLVQCQSPSVKGHFKIAHLDSSVVSSDAKWNAFRSQNLKKVFVLVDTSGVRDKKQLDILNNFVKYPVGVKGILLPRKANPIEGTNGSTKLEPWDVSTKQAGTAIIEIDEALKNADAIDVNIAAKFLKSHGTQNIIGYVPGSEKQDSFIVFTAHYDHLGQMGANTFFPGANDNASGIAMLLSLARYYSQPEHKPKCSIAFIAFAGEEAGLIGSAYYAQHPLFPLTQIKFLVNMDIMGTGDEGITVVNATQFPFEFKQLQDLNAKSNYLTNVKPRGKAAISDHYFFTELHVRCFYIYTLGGIKAYHDIFDRRETLPLTKFDELFSLLRDFADWEDGK